MRSPSPQISQSGNTPEPSLTGTSAPLLTQPPFTNYLSNYPLWPNHAKESTEPSSSPSSPSVAIPSATSPQPPPTAPSIKRGRGRTRNKSLQRKAQGKTASKAQKPKTGHSDGISEPLPAETQTTAQIQMWNMWPT